MLTCEALHTSWPSSSEDFAFGTVRASILPARSGDQLLRDMTGDMSHCYDAIVKSSSPRIINVTSGAGSLSRRLEANTPFYKVREPQYRVSKAAMNMIAACQMVDFEEEGWKVFLYCPGFCESNLGPQNNASNSAKPASEGAKPMVDMLDGKRDDEAGKYLHYGGEYPW